MKKIKNHRLFFRLIIILFSIPLCIWCFSLSFPILRVCADGEKVQTQLEETIVEELNRLDLERLEDYLKSLQGFNEKSVVDYLLDYVKGVDFDYKSLSQALLDIFFNQVKDVLPVFACITAVALLSGIVSTLKSGMLGQTSSEMIFIVTYLAALIPLIGALTGVFRASVGAINAMKEQMQLIFPLMLTLIAASGGSVSATICRPAVAFFSTTIVSVISSVVFPITITIILFSMASKLTNQLKIGKFTTFFKSINKWIIGVCVSVFGLFFTLQGITGAIYDGVVRRAAKYAIGNGIPIIGGFLSGGFDFAVAGGVLIKNSLGSMGIFLMLSVLFEPIALLVAVNLLLRFVSAITQSFGDGRISDFLGETAENLHYCTAGLLFVAFLYFLSIVVLIFSTEALF